MKVSLVSFFAPVLPQTPSRNCNHEQSANDGRSSEHNTRCCTHRRVARRGRDQEDLLVISMEAW